MDRDTDRYRSLTRRAITLGAMKLGLLGVLGGRLYQLQITEGEHFRTLAEENRINMRLIAPSRGRILDRTGIPLAVNDQNFRVVLVAEEAGDVAATLDRLGGLIGLTATDRERTLRDVRRQPRFVPVTVRENLTWEQVSRIEVNAPELPGLSIEVGERRRYPFDRVTAHILGYVGAVSEEELTGDPVLSLPGFRIGKNGIERQHDTALRGVAGTRQIEVNAVGRAIRELERNEGEPGQDVELTLDLGLQEYALNRIQTLPSAAVVILDAVTGEIFALASTPSYDPNPFTVGIGRAAWRALIDNPYVPLTNKAIAGQYAPGSTFKPVVALAGLQEGIVTPDFKVACSGAVQLGNYRFHCWRRHGHGRLGMVQALAQSCDVYFYELARRVGVDRIATMANRLGIGHTLGVDLPGERPGLMPTTTWKQEALGQRWQQGETLIAGIGQGYVLSTPLQLAVMVARVVNGGRAIQPHLTRRVGGPQTPLAAHEAPDLGIDPVWLDIVREGMIAVTSGAGGTARGAQIPVAGMEMGGKTGTSQVRRITAAERATGIIPNDRRPWNDRDHALFIAFAPIASPRYAGAVIVEHGGGGSAVAAPIMRDILLEAQRRAPARRLVPLGADQVAATSGAP